MKLFSSPPIVLPPSSSIIVTVEVAYGEAGTEDESVRLNCLLDCGILFPKIVKFTNIWTSLGPKTRVVVMLV